jgi:hypothetical protein
LGALRLLRRSARPAEQQRSNQQRKETDQMNGSRSPSPETRRKLSKAMKRHWAAKRGEVPPIEGSGNFHTVKYVADDEVTAKVELLRKLFTSDELVEEFSALAFQRVRDAKGGSGE